MKANVVLQARIETNLKELRKYISKVTYKNLIDDKHKTTDKINLIIDIDAPTKCEINFEWDDTIYCIDIKDKLLIDLDILIDDEMFTLA